MATRTAPTQKTPTPAKAPARKAASKVARKTVRKAVAPKAPAAPAKPATASKPAVPPQVKTAQVAKPAKPVKAAKPTKVAKPPKSLKADKPAKADKVVRDSFTMPQSDFDIIDRIKLRAIEWKQPVKKSEVLRAGLQALEALSDAKVRALLAGLAPIKKGRPKAD